MSHAYCKFGFIRGKGGIRVETIKKKKKNSAGSALL